MIFTSFRLFGWMLFLFAITGCSHPTYFFVEAPIEPKLISIHIVDQNGMTETIGASDRLDRYTCVDFLKPQPYKKVIRSYSRNAEGNTSSIITTYYENGQIQRYLETLSNRAHGWYREWHENGAPRIEAYVLGGAGDVGSSAECTWQFDGCAKAWDECGNLLSTVQYSKGKLEGESLTYYPSGKLLKKSFFTHGELCGNSYIYYEDGAVMHQFHYNNGKLDGNIKRFWEDGSIAADEIYSNNNLITGHYFTCTGEEIYGVTDGNGTRAEFGMKAVVELQQFVNGKMEGEIREFTEEGNLVRVWHVKEGEKEGSEILYYQNQGLSNKRPIPKLEVTWHESKLQGIVRTWYPSGQQESQRELSNNVKNGLLSAWYKDGSLMLVENYENDKLIKGEYYRRGDKAPISEIDEGAGVATLYDSEGNFLRKVTYRNSKPLLD